MTPDGIDAPPSICIRTSGTALRDHKRGCESIRRQRHDVGAVAGPRRVRSPQPNANNRRSNATRVSNGQLYRDWRRIELPSTQYFIAVVTYAKPTGSEISEAHPSNQIPDENASRQR
jgi:hypothetical protein